jgi:protein O-mannosyl-transferase
VIGLVQVGVQAMADRYAYLPYIGLFMGVVWAAAEAARRRRIAAAWVAGPAILILLGLGIVTHRQVGYWHDSETLWRYTLSITKGNYLAHDELARALADEGRVEDAIVQYNAAEDLHAYSAADMITVGTFEQTHGHVQEAIEQYRRSMDAAPDAKSRAVALSWMGSAFTQTGDIQRAKLSYEYALRENPANGAALVGSGLLAEREGNFGFAADRISQAMKVEPTDVGYLLLEQALRRAGRAAEANEAGAQAKRVSSNMAQAQKSAAEVLASAGIRAN